MDFDSSTKFISSLAKFLQSLCNGYVEFDNGVEVIGHIYLSVDTGKKIDYILNEKVCKTDENSVTFISNSFHAQPAEKPKPPPSKISKIAPEKEEKTADDDDIILMDDPESPNTGTVLTRDNTQHQNNNSQSNFNNSTGASKRSYNQHHSSNRPSKHRRLDSSNPNGASTNSHDSNNSSFNLPSEISNVTAASESDLSHLSQVLTDNNSSNVEDRDIKPVLDSDMNVVNVKQEYDPSADSQESSNLYNEQQDEGGYYSGMPSHDSSYDMGGSQYYGGRRGTLQHSEYGEIGSGDMYSGGTGDSGGTMMGDSQGQGSGKSKKCPVHECGVVTCRYNRHWLEKHEPVIKVYCCPLCPSKSKRKSHLHDHMKRSHGSKAINDAECAVDYISNKQFIDPYPYTLDS